MSPEELAKLFEIASERWIMMTTIADPAKLDNYLECSRMCDFMAKSLQMALLDEADLLRELAQISTEMHDAHFCTICGQKLTYGINRCPKCGKRPGGP